MAGAKMDVMQPPIEPMFAASVDTLPRSCSGGCAYEPKWDGWRVILFAARGRTFLQSRTGKPLADYFPDLMRVARIFLPSGVVLDGELIIWDRSRERTSFALLHRRITSGRALEREAADHPAHLVCFDLLQDLGGPQLNEPLATRRERLAALLADAPPQLALCPQTTDPEEALGWLEEWRPAGVEGLVVKGLATTYQPGRRSWAKLRALSTTEATIGGVTGSLAEPETLLLGMLDENDTLRYVGRTKPLTAGGRREIAAVASPPRLTQNGEPDHPWPTPLPPSWIGQFGNTTPLTYQQVLSELVVEVETDAAFEYGRWRHPPRFVRLRPTFRSTM
jgi:ATP-dependent DNA ligase